MAEEKKEIDTLTRKLFAELRDSSKLLRGLYITYGISNMYFGHDIIWLFNFADELSPGEDMAKYWSDLGRWVEKPSVGKSAAEEVAEWPEKMRKDAQKMLDEGQYAGDNELGQVSVDSGEAQILQFLAKYSTRQIITTTILEGTTIKSDKTVRKKLIQLEEKDLIHRPDGNDRRTGYAITEKGKSVADSLPLEPPENY